VILADRAVQGCVPVAGTGAAVVGVVDPVGPADIAVLGIIPIARTNIAVCPRPVDLARIAVGLGVPFAGTYVAKLPLPVIQTFALCVLIAACHTLPVLWANLRDALVFIARVEPVNVSLHTGLIRLRHRLTCELPIPVFDAFLAWEATVARMCAFLVIETPHNRNTEKKNHNPQATPHDQGN